MENAKNIQLKQDEISKLKQLITQKQSQFQNEQSVSLI